MGERGNWADGLLRGIGDAISDARSKLIDEGWFGGREAAPGSVSSLGWTTEGAEPARGFDMPRQSFEDAWAPRGREPMRDIPHQGEPAFGTDAWIDWANAVTRDAESGVLPMRPSFEEQWAVRAPGGIEHTDPAPNHDIDR